MLSRRQNVHIMFLAEDISLVSSGGAYLIWMSLSSISSFSFHLVFSLADLYHGRGWVCGACAYARQEGVEEGRKKGRESERNT